MLREIGRWRALANAVFALAVLALGASASIRSPAASGGCSRLFTCEPGSRRSAASKPAIVSEFRGSTPGVVEKVIPPHEPGGPVELVLRIDERLRGLVRTDAVARIVSEGLVGAKLVELTPGKPGSPQVADLDMIASEKPIELTELMQKAAASLARLDAATLAAEKGLGRVNAIAGS